MKLNDQRRTRRGKAQNTIKYSTTVRSTFEFDAAIIFNDLSIMC